MKKLFLNNAFAFLLITLNLNVLGQYSLPPRTIRNCTIYSMDVPPENSTVGVLTYLHGKIVVPQPFWDMLNCQGNFGSGNVMGFYEDMADDVDQCGMDYVRTYVVQSYLNDHLYSFTVSEHIRIETYDDDPQFGTLAMYDYPGEDEVVYGDGINDLPTAKDDDLDCLENDVSVPCDDWSAVEFESKDSFISGEPPYVRYKRVYKLSSACTNAVFAEVTRYYKQLLPFRASPFMNKKYVTDVQSVPVYTRVQEIENDGCIIKYNEKFKKDLLIEYEESNHPDIKDGKIRTYTITNVYDVPDGPYRMKKVKQEILPVPERTDKYEFDYESGAGEEGLTKLYLLGTSLDDGCDDCPDYPWKWYHIHFKKYVDGEKEPEEYDITPKNLEQYFFDPDRIIWYEKGTKNEYYEVVINDTMIGDKYELAIVSEKACQVEGNPENDTVLKTTINPKPGPMMVYANPIAAIYRGQGIGAGVFVASAVTHLMHLDKNRKPVYSGTCEELTYDNLKAKHRPDLYQVCGKYQVFEPGWVYSWEIKGGQRLSSIPYYSPYDRFGMNFDIYYKSYNYDLDLNGEHPELLLTKNSKSVKITAEKAQSDGHIRKMVSKTRDITSKTLLCSKDPNEITGPEGYGEDRMIAAKDRIDYRIYFENDTTATSAAGRVTVHCPLHARADSTTVRLGSFGFGDFMFEVPSLAAYYNNRITETEDSLGVWVDVTAGYDMDNNEMYWIFQSIDPETGVAPIDSVGFLPVNDTLIGNGEGYVTFSVTALGNTMTGDTIAEKATIIFDENDPVETNVYVNKFDAVAPTSVLVGDTLTVHDNYCLNFKALGTDDEGGSGIGKIDVYVNVDHTQYVYATTLESCADSTEYDYGDTLCGSYQIGQGAVYDFIARATDNTGNVEPFKPNSEFTFLNKFPPLDIFLTNRVFNENDKIGTKIGDFYAIDDQSTDDFKYRLVECEDNSHKKFMIDSCFLYTNYDYRCKDTLDFSIIVECTDNTGEKLEKVFQLHAIQTETPEVTYTDTVVCYGETVEFGGKLLSIDGDYYDTLQTAGGCDSVVRLTLVHYPQLELKVVDTIHCIYEDFITDEFDLPWTTIEQRLTNWTQTGDTLLVYEQDVPNGNDCPQPVRLDMHVYPITTDFHHVDICANGLPFRYGDSLFFETCTKDVVFASKISGCDSIVTVELVTHPTYTVGTPMEATICSNEEFELFGNTFTEAGVYQVHGETAIHHCDSVVNLTLNVNPISEKYLPYTVCPTDLPQDDYYGFNLYKNITSGLYHDTLVAKNGCDSIVTLDLTVRDATIQTNDIYNGWNWYSTYLDLTEIDGMQTLKDSLKDKGELIKSQYQFVSYENGEWTNIPMSIENERMYMIKANADIDVNAFSCIAEGADHPITIYPGWNWIGFVSRYAMPIETAMSGLNVMPQEGDIIKSFDHGFVSYYADYGGWLGSLTQMQPGAGYMYKSNASGNVTLTYPTVPGNKGEAMELLPTHWKVTNRNFSNNMTFIGKITIDNMPATIEEYEVGVFHNNEVRGSGRAIMMEGLGIYRLFIQVYGNQNDELTFKLYDHGHDCEYDAVCFQKAYFVENANYGSIKDPYVFKFYTDNLGVDEEDSSREITLFPNPANSSTRVLLYGDFTAEERNGLTVTVLNPLGVKIQQIEPTRYPVQLKEVEYAGAYTVVVTTGTGRTVVKKLVVTR